MSKTHTEYLLKKATEHICYEVDMFYTTLLLLATAKNQIDVNILLDAFSIHTRNLFDFFYPKKNKHDDDIVITDFPINLIRFNKLKTKKKELAFIVRKADKQVAHLTYARNRYSSKSKPWPFISVGRKMFKNLHAFYDTLPNHYKALPNIKAIKTIIDKLSRSQTDK